VLLESATTPSLARDLLLFYQKRVDGFEAEKQELLKRLEVIDGSKKQLRELEARLTRREMEVREMQQALSDAHEALLREREKSIGLATQVHELQVLQQDDRRKIQHLLAMTQPVGHEVTFLRDQAPEKLVRGWGEPTRAASAARAADPHVVRTVLLPSETAEAKEATIAALRKHIEELEAVARDRAAAAAEDRRLRDEEARRREEQLREELERLREEARRESLLHQMTTRDFLLLKQQLQASEQRYNENMARMETHRKQLLEYAQQVRREAGASSRRAREQVESRAGTIIEQLRTQARSKGEDATSLRLTLEETRSALTSRLGALEEKESYWRKKFWELDRKRNLEFEGYTREAKLLRKQLRELQALVLARADAPDGGDGKEEELRAARVIDDLIDQFKSSIERKHQEARASAAEMV
jgi:coiled-coil domain-containing protein 77